MDPDRRKNEEEEEEQKGGGGEEKKHREEQEKRRRGKTGGCFFQGVVIHYVTVQRFVYHFSVDGHVGFIQLFPGTNHIALNVFFLRTLFGYMHSFFLGSK